MRLCGYILALSVVSSLIVSCGKKPNASDFEVWGIDISKHQTSIDWEKVCSYNQPHFVFLKATEGLIIIDPSYDKHIKELNKRKILWGAYHFFGHRTSGKDQARNFIRTAKLKHGNLLPVLDIEPHRFMTDPKKSVREAMAFCKEIKRYYGKNPIIYCSSNFYDNYMRKDFPKSKYILWIANYNDCPQNTEWHFWQHTESHRIKGVSGNVDRNVFAGDSNELKTMIL